MTKKNQLLTEKERLKRNKYNRDYHARRKASLKANPEKKAKIVATRSEKRKKYDEAYKANKKIRTAEGLPHWSKDPIKMQEAALRTVATKKANKALNLAMENLIPKKSQPRDGYLSSIELLVLDGVEQKFNVFISGLRKELRGSK